MNIETPDKFHKSIAIEQIHGSNGGNIMLYSDYVCISVNELLN